MAEETKEYTSNDFGEERERLFELATVLIKRGLSQEEFEEAKLLAALVGPQEGPFVEPEDMHRTTVSLPTSTMRRIQQLRGARMYEEGQSITLDEVLRELVTTGMEHTADAQP